MDIEPKDLMKVLQVKGAELAVMQAVVEGLSRRLAETTAELEALKINNGNRNGPI